MAFYCIKEEPSQLNYYTQLVLLLLKSLLLCRLLILKIGSFKSFALLFIVQILATLLAALMNICSVNEFFLYFFMLSLILFRFLLIQLLIKYLVFVMRLTIQWILISLVSLLINYECANKFLMDTKSTKEGGVE